MQVSQPKPIPWTYLKALFLLSFVLCAVVPIYRTWLAQMPSIAPASSQAQDASRFLGRWQGNWGGVVIFTLDFKQKLGQHQLKGVLQHWPNPGLGIDDRPLPLVANFTDGELHYGDKHHQTRLWFEGEQLWAELSGEHQGLSKLQPIREGEGNP
ncbi:hypothetical protein [Aliagarivorans taiwanensis]|uniref:hypothetical protein n=1 Tax=Aliagarivorans taiwanensis TaxID=561966 RepID=UPI00041FF886|nr:hypothetical protein [Aliagarivorans taiwanensis]